jgi:transcriptional regulator with XRE-family HTH domain
MARARQTAPGVGERIQSLVGKDQTLEQFAQDIGVSSRTLGNYLRGEREPSYDFLRRVRTICGADINWLITGEGTPGTSPVARAGSTDQVAIPRCSFKPSTPDGPLTLSSDNETYLSVPRAWLARYLPQGSIPGIMDATGDTMEPTITNGDLLLLDLSIDRSAVKEGGVFVISIDNTLLVKRFQLTLDNHLLIRSDNDLYEQQKVTREFAEERITVHAEVVWVGGPVRRR